VAPVGELDLATVPILETHITAARERGSRWVILDLRGLEFMDSTGLRCILDHDADARRDGFKIALIQGTPAVQRLFEITGTESRLVFVEG
jgi:anti-sigma B factor antagonist